MPRKNAHRGVTVFRHRGEWVARWTDPVSGRRTQQTIADLRSDSARSDWAIRKSWEIAAIKRAHAGGAEAAPSSLADAAAAYMARIGRTRRTLTMEVYRRHLAIAAAWADATGRATLGRWTRADIAALGDHMAGLGGTGATINCRLRSVRAFLRDALSRDMLPLVREHHVRAALGMAPVADPLREHLTRAQLRELLQASLDTGPVWGRETCGLVLFVLLTGMRAGEAMTLTGRSVRLPELRDSGDAGEIRVSATHSKTRRERAVDMGVSPALARLATRLAEAAGDRALWPHLDRPFYQASARAIRRKLPKGHPFTWQGLRVTAATFLTCAPGIFGAASVYRSAAQLGHDVAVAQRHYLGLVRDIPRDATTLEAAMGIADEALAIARTFRWWGS